MTCLDLEVLTTSLDITVTDKYAYSGGSYSIYYALAVASKQLDLEHREHAFVGVWAGGVPDKPECIWVFVAAINVPGIGS
ncbi:hypothetical protein HYQ44_020364 [Verticillium longisporum]|nr:hypothetical protein HYQ44_020364 [Verticillium longisporum]